MNIDETDGIELITGKLQDWADNLLQLLPNILLAFLILGLFYVVAKLVRRSVQGLGSKISNNRAVTNLVAMLAYIATLLIGLTVALEVMNLGGAATSILAGAGIAGIAIGFAFQDIAANFISGIVLAVQRPFKINDLIETNETFGHVRHINLRSTEVETLQGQMVHIPNKEILLNPLIDYSYEHTRRIDLPVGVAYATDLQVAEDLTIKTVKKLKFVTDKKTVDLYYEEFGESSINFTVRFWIKFDAQIDYLGAKSDAIKAIKKAFDEAEISIPFPMRTLEFMPGELEKVRKK